MKIAYRSDRCTIYVGDCREALPELESGSCGLLATDPPYGVEWESHFAKHRKFDQLVGDDGLLDVPAILGTAMRTIARCRHVYVFGYRADLIAEPMRLSATTEIIWNKGQVGLGDLTQPWGPQHERITFGMYVPSKANRENGMGNLAARMRRGSVINVPRRNSASAMRHPTEKPVALMRQIVEASTVLGDVVLDPFAGVGSTLVAAVLLGRRAIGIEIDPGYAAIAAQRVRDAEQIASQMEAA